MTGAPRTLWTANGRRRLEYFHDHVRIEKMAFGGTLSPETGGVLRPDRGAPGHGLTVKQADPDEFRVR